MFAVQAPLFITITITITKVTIMFKAITITLALFAIFCVGVVGTGEALVSAGKVTACKKCERDYKAARTRSEALEMEAARLVAAGAETARAR